MYPRTERRKLAVVHVPPGVELRLRAVVAVGRPHRAYDRQPVDVGPDPREIIAHLDATLTMLPIASLHRIERHVHRAIGIGRNNTLDGQLLGIQHVSEGSLGDRLSGVFVQHRFRIEAFDVAAATVHEQPDHVFRFRREVRKPSRGRPARFTAKPFAIEHDVERQPGATHAHVRQESAPRRSFL